MGKIAFLFAGQGDQYPGMGRTLSEAYPTAAQGLAAFDLIRPGTSALCFDGTAEELQETRNTQPCLFAMEMTAAGILKDKGVVPDAAAGFSLGEVTAATACGIFSPTDGFRIVCQRGELMQREAERIDTFMAAVLRLSTEKLEEICAGYPDIYPANYNCPGQVTVSGTRAMLKVFSDEVRAAGGRVVVLRVGGAFHSPFMDQAAKNFRKVLQAAEIRHPAIPLYANATGERYKGTASDTIETLSGQICRPVLWEQLICRMIDDGIDTFVEIGPGRTLTNMVHKIHPGVCALTVYEILEEASRC